MLAGALNAVAGGGGFIAFPSLLFTGMLPINANATNTVALWPGTMASVGAYRRELQAALCRYELPAVPPGPSPRLLLAIAGLDDAERLCNAGAWIALSDRCAAEAWTVFTAAGQRGHAPLWDRC